MRDDDQDDGEPISEEAAERARVFRDRARKHLEEHPEEHRRIAAHLLGSTLEAQREDPPTDQETLMDVLTVTFGSGTPRDVALGRLSHRIYEMGAALQPPPTRWQRFVARLRSWWPRRPRPEEDAP